MSLDRKSNIQFASSSERATERTKPPHSYIALIATAILNSPKQKLTLTEINEYLVKNYSFFRGSYQGWKNSVRHNLSFNKCFVKILRDPARPWGKDNLWAVNDLHDYLLADGSFRRRRRRKPKKDKSVEEARDELFGGTMNKQQLSQVKRTEDENKIAPRFPVLEIPSHKRHPGTCRATQQVKGSVSPKRFSGPFSIESILASDRYKVKQSRGEMETARAHTVATLTTRQVADLTSSTPQAYISETDSLEVHNCCNLFSHPGQYDAKMLGCGEVLGVYSTTCSCFHQVAPCSCQQYVHYCY